MKNKKMKKGPLSNAEKTKIDKMLQNGDDVLTIADATRRSENILKKYINSVAAPESSVVSEVVSEAKPEEQVTESESLPRTRTASLFARNEKYGVTVMTEQASSAGDESRHKRINTGTHRYSECTTTIRKVKK